MNIRKRNKIGYELDKKKYKISPLPKTYNILM